MTEHAIGIGCFLFSPKPNANDKLDSANWKDFLAQIKSTLEKVDNVSEVKIHGAYDQLRTGFLYDENPSDNDDDADKESNFIPIYSGKRIEFNLFLPFRVQEHFSKGLTRKCATEKFRLVIVYGYEMPVTYIIQDIPTKAKKELTDPSAPVMFIREYLEEKLANDPHCQFKALGPSPFHADIFLDFKKGAPQTIKAENVSLTRRGYDDILIEVTAEEQGDAIELFIEQYHEIIESFYNLVWLRNKSLHNTVHIINASQAILEITKSPDSNWHKSRKIKELIDISYEKILDDKLNKIEINDDIANKTRNEIFNKKNIFYPFIDREIEEIPKAPIEEIREILTISEARRQKYFSNITTLFAGLVGAIIGALFGSFLTYALTSNNTQASSPNTKTNPPINSSQVKPKSGAKASQ